MTPDSVGPFSRPFVLARLPDEGREVTVAATAAECAALAADLGLDGIERLEARLRVASERGRVRVTGRVDADIRQTCVVSLDIFPSRLCEEVDVEFAPGGGGREPSRPGEEIESDLDAPDELLGDRLDLGAITAEFLALGLDPHPRKPGATLDYQPDETDADSPFAALAGLKGEDR